MIWLIDRKLRSMLILVVLCLVLSWIKFSNGAVNEAFCNIYNDPLIKPFLSNRVVKCDRTVMNPGSYVLMSNDPGKCPLRRSPRTWSRTIVVAEVGSPLDSDFSPSGYSVNKLVVHFPDVNYSFKIGKDKSLKVKLPSDPQGTFSLSPTLPYYLHFGGSADNYVNIRMEDTSGLDRSLVLETGPGLTVGIRGHYSGGVKWGRVKLILPTDKLSEMCGLCDLASYSQSYLSNSALFSALASEVYPFGVAGESTRTWQQWSSPTTNTNWGKWIPGSVKRVVVQPTGWVRWSSQSWSGTTGGSTSKRVVNPPTTRPRGWVDWNSQSWPGVGTRKSTTLRPKGWVNWTAQSWSGTAPRRVDATTKSIPRRWVDWSSSFSGSSKPGIPSGWLDWSLQDYTSKSGSGPIFSANDEPVSQNRRRRIASVANQRGLPEEIGRFIANQSAGNELEIASLIHWLTSLFAKRDHVGPPIFANVENSETTRSSQTTQVQVNQTSGPQKPPPSLFGGSRFSNPTANEHVGRNSDMEQLEAGRSSLPASSDKTRGSSTLLGLFNPFHGFDLNGFLSNEDIQSAYLHKGNNPSIASPEMSENSLLPAENPRLSPFSILSGSGILSGSQPGLPGAAPPLVNPVINIRRTPAVGGRKDCRVIMDENGPFGNCFEVDDFNSTVQTALCKFITASSTLDPPETAPSSDEMCEAFSTVRSNCLDMTRDQLTIDLDALDCPV